jgi:hypothetical protein
VKVITPIQITDAILTSTTVSEPSASESAWSATAVYGIGDKTVLGTLSSTVTISNGAPAIITWAGNNLGIGTPVRFTVAGGALPTGLTAGVVYYLVLRIGLNAFVVSDTLNGAPIVTSSAGSGTFTCTAAPHRSYTCLTGATGIGVTITLATPGVVTWTSHGRAAGDAIVFTNSGGALPTGITAGTTYYVIATGLTADTFQFSQSLGGTAVNTSGAQSGTHTCGLALTYNKPPMLNTNVWGDSGASNQVACFDLYRNSATSGASPMTVVLTPGARADSLAMLGLVGTQAVVTVTSASGGGTVYGPKTISLVTRPVSNWYEYFFKPFLFQTAFALFDLPPYSDAVITIVLSDPAGRVQVSDIVIGMQTDIGGVKYRAGSDLLSFATVTRDAYGGVTMTPVRNTSKNTFELRIAKGAVDEVRAVRAALDAKPAVWAGVTDSSDGYYGAFLSKGFYRRFPINADLPNWAEATLELEGI